MAQDRSPPDFIEVVVNGNVVRVRSVEEAAQLLRLIGTKDDDGHGDGDDWDEESVKEFVNCLREASKKMIFALSDGESATTQELAERLGNEDGKGIGPMKGFIKRAAEDLQMPNPVVTYRSGKIGLSRSFSVILRRLFPEE